MGNPRDWQESEGTANVLRDTSTTASIRQSPVCVKQHRRRRFEGRQMGDGKVFARDDPRIRRVQVIAEEFIRLHEAEGFFVQLPSGLTLRDITTHREPDGVLIRANLVKENDSGLGLLLPPIPPIPLARIAVSSDPPKVLLYPDSDREYERQIKERTYEGLQYDGRSVELFEYPDGDYQDLVVALETMFGDGRLRDNLDPFLDEKLGAFEGSTEPVQKTAKPLPLAEEAEPTANHAASEQPKPNGATGAEASDGASVQGTIMPRLRRRKATEQESEALDTYRIVESVLDELCEHFKLGYSRAQEKSIDRIALGFWRQSDVMSTAREKGLSEQAGHDLIAEMAKELIPASSAELIMDWSSESFKLLCSLNLPPEWSEYLQNKLHAGGIKPVVSMLPSVLAKVPPRDTSSEQAREQSVRSSPVGEISADLLTRLGEITEPDSTHDYSALIPPVESLLASIPNELRGNLPKQAKTLAEYLVIARLFERSGLSEEKFSGLTQEKATPPGREKRRYSEFVSVAKLQDAKRALKRIRESKAFDAKEQGN